MDLLIKEIYVIDPKNGRNGAVDVLIKKGKISSLKKEIKADGIEIYDGKGKYLFPGLIDMHVHFREPGFEQKETVASGARSALRGGFVAVVTMPNTNPPCDHHSIIDNIIRKANEVPFYVFPSATLTKDRAGKELSEMVDLKRAGALAVTDDGDWVADSLLMRRALEYASMLDLLVISHAEDKRLTAGGVMNEGVMSTKLGLKGIPNASEEIAVSRDLLLGKLTQARLHITHISTLGSVELIRRAKKEGVLVTCDATPHHLLLTDEALKTYDTNYKMMPPLRTEEDRLALIAGIQDGTIDAVVTDHAPHTEEEKMEEYPTAPFGVIGLETSLAAVLTELYHERKMSLDQVVRLMSVKPAEILKLPKGFGSIEEGSEANLTIVDLNEEWIAHKDEFISKSKNSAFIGKHFKGKAVGTICRGKLWQGLY